MRMKWQCGITVSQLLISFLCFFKVIPEAYSRTDSLLRFAKDKINVAFSFTRNYKNMTHGTIPSNLERLNLQTTYGNLQINRMVFLPVPVRQSHWSLEDRGWRKDCISLTFAESIQNESIQNTGFSREPDMIRIRNRTLEYICFPEKVSERAIE